ncbi:MULTISPECIES: adenine phosphoribosyltransferase [Nocardiopsis]|jgi:adenine phosphoribosyltransferase|uniref:Adenine phosphoribosyltransferase n=2 Tax=Nocardiopsis alba TaxID=53437 RepID=A0A7K2IWP7_9ACTN|nr:MULTISPECIES: adenine phosphoribosyltransferase [Nocardiopsis]AFR08400.1 adenine phosphoribosyltransferase [Nocardiopsis alba ATCC BAA-2165]MEC3892226.1 adenine phosphoribosyltransferase [Nocardiopsis sp. LDBS1602]MYR34408.1 adenine phosphoribosyltransferase [Nocardiopsis alba]
MPDDTVTPEIAVDLALIESRIRDVPDFPHEGILFKDITPLLAHREAFAAAVDGMSAPFRAEGVDHVVGLEARGFIFGAPIAMALGAGFVPARKAGKLPAKTIDRSYDLEYGTATVEIHADAIAPGARVLIVDDVLATGGTGRAAVELVRKAGGTVVGFSVLMELAALRGREMLPDVEPHILLSV